MSLSLSQSQLEAFATDGVIPVRQVVPRELLAELERAIDRRLAGSPLLSHVLFGDAGFVTRPNPWKTDPFFFELVQLPVFAQLAAQLLDSRRINLLQDQIFAKRRGSEQVFGWHQDLAYSPVAGEKMVSLWMACGPVDRETSAVQFARGSHRRPMPVQRPRLSRVEGLFRPAQRDSIEIPEQEVLCFELEPGDLVAFHGGVLHRSGPNQSDRVDRKGYAVRMVGDAMTYRPSAADGITYQFWDAQLEPGAALGGPLFPTLLEEGQHLHRPFPGPEPMRLSRMLLTPLRAIRGRLFGAREA